MHDFVSNSGDEPAYERNEAKHNHDNDENTVLSCDVYSYQQYQNMKVNRQFEAIASASEAPLIYTGVP